jgi:hypothetical protein
MAFIRINRKLFDHFLWKENRVYSRAEAWIDLIQLVTYNPKGGTGIISGVTVRWNRGQFPISYSFLAKRWTWNIHKTRIFLSMLKESSQITTVSTSVTTILTICNYDFYNPMSQAEVQADGIAKQRNDSLLTQNTASETAQVSSIISTSNNDNSQADIQADGKRTASGRHELNKENKVKNKEKEEEKEIFISNPEEEKPKGYHDIDFANISKNEEDLSFLDIIEPNS